MINSNLNKNSCVLFNCSTNIIGGGVKNSAIFIKQALKYSELKWKFAISKEVQDLLNKWNISTEGMHLFETSPARSRKMRERLKRLADRDVDIVYTMAGPAYTKFNQTHLMGISNPYMTHADIQGVICGRSIRQILRILFSTIYGATFIKKANYFIFQTNEARNGFCKRFFVKKDRTKVISNAIGTEFKSHFDSKPINSIDLSKKNIIFCPGAAYPHKALHLIPKIAKELLKYANNKFNFEFVLTLEKNSEVFKKTANNSNKLAVSKYIRSIGSYSYSEAIELHKNADIIFIPSLLETFSASYLEAFSAKKPLVVADKGFARDICQNGAVYVNPNISKETAKKLNDLIIDSHKQVRLVKNGLKILDSFGDQENRFLTIIEYLNSLK